jgi:hypothetical protein
MNQNDTSLVLVTTATVVLSLVLAERASTDQRSATEGLEGIKNGQ